MAIIESIKVGHLGERIRLSDLDTSDFISIGSRKALKKAIAKKRIVVDGQPGKTASWLTGGEVIEVLQEERPFKILKLKLEVVFEDNHLAIINKPAGIVVSGNKHRTIVNALPFNLKPSSEPGALPYPMPIHRLDYETSGLLIIAKTHSSLISLNAQLANGQIDKKYICISIGPQDSSGTLTTDIKEKNAETRFKTLQSIPSKRFKKLNLTEVQLITGRRHQIRIHFLRNGNPILGDSKHFIEDKILNGKGLFLHAYKVNFNHPINNNPIDAEIETPKKFKRLFGDYLNGI